MKQLTDNVSETKSAIDVPSVIGTLFDTADFVLQKSKTYQGWQGNDSIESEH